MKRTLSTLVAAGFAVALLSGSAQAEAVKGNPANLIAPKKCAMCHKKDSVGNQVGKLAESPHAKAFETLGTAAAKEIGAKQGIDNPQESGKCLKCHSTAYYFSETRQSEEVEVEIGVDCQSCHGPGAEFKSKEVHGKDRELAMTKGFIYPSLEKSCTNCHNDESPTMKEPFDAKKMYEKIKHERPAE